MAGGALSPLQESICQQLIGFGIDEARARRACQERSFPNVDAAMNYLLDNSATNQAPLLLTDQSQKEDPGFQRAIAESLGHGGGATTQDRQELAINQAIEASLKTASPQGFVDPDDPNKRVRQLSPLLPVGLKNTGNICYFNSLLQLYANIPWVATAIMTANIKPEVATAPAVLLLKELQRSLAFLQLSARKYFDPAPCVNALFKFNEKGSSQQSDKKMQHDVAEFNEIILHGIDAAFQETKTGTDFVKNTLYGTLSQEFEGPGLPVQRTDVEVGPLILDIQGGDLMGALDAYTDSAIDKYKLSSGEVTTATKSLWFHRLPKVLCLQLQRVAYDAAKKEVLKVNTRFNFPCNIYLERFLVKNQEVALSKKRKLKEFRDQQSNLSQELARFKKFGDREVPLLAALEASLEFFGTGVPGLAPAQQQRMRELWIGSVTGPERGQAMRCLNQSIKAVKTEVDDLEKKLAAVEDDITHVFDGMEKKKYQLLAVLVHEGRRAEQGHYWSYVRPSACYMKDAPEDGWFKYNDAQCTRVTQKEVFEEASGGHATKASSAYFLVYTEAPLEDEPAFGADAKIEEGIASFIPDSLRAEILADNEKFDAEKAQWAKQEQTKSCGNKAEALVERFTNKMEDVDKLVAILERRGAVPATTTTTTTATTTTNTSTTSATATASTTTTTTAATIPAATTTTATTTATATTTTSTPATSDAEKKLAEDNLKISMAAFLCSQGRRDLAQLLVLQITANTLQEEGAARKSTTQFTAKTSNILHPFRPILEEFQKKLKAQGHPCVPLFSVTDQGIVPVANAAEALARTPAEFSACVDSGKAIELGFKLFQENKFSEALDVLARITQRVSIWGPFYIDIMGACLYKVVTEAQRVLRGNRVDDFDAALQTLEKENLYVMLRQHPNRDLVESLKTQMIDLCSEAEDSPLLESFNVRLAPILNNFLTYEVDTAKPAEETSVPPPSEEKGETNFQVLVSSIRRKDADLLNQKMPFLAPVPEMGKPAMHSKDEGKKEDEPQKI